MTRFVLQDPSSDLSYSNDWTDFLAAGESISSRAWAIAPDASPTLLSNARSATVRVAGLTAGVVYQLSEKITTSSNNDAERSITISCEER